MKQKSTTFGAFGLLVAALGLIFGTFAFSGTTAGASPVRPKTPTQTIATGSTLLLPTERLYNAYPINDGQTLTLPIAWNSTGAGDFRVPANVQGVLATITIDGGAYWLWPDGESRPSPAQAIHTGGGYNTFQRLIRLKCDSTSCTGKTNIFASSPGTAQTHFWIDVEGYLQ